jgi:hypothetical protein
LTSQILDEASSGVFRWSAIEEELLATIGNFDETRRNWTKVAEHLGFRATRAKSL